MYIRNLEYEPTNPLLVNPYATTIRSSSQSNPPQINCSTFSDQSSAIQCLHQLHHRSNSGNLHPLLLLPLPLHLRMRVSSSERHSASALISLLPLLLLLQVLLMRALSMASEFFVQKRSMDVDGIMLLILKLHQFALSVFRLLNHLRMYCILTITLIVF